MIFIKVVVLFGLHHFLYCSSPSVLFLKLKLKENQSLLATKKTKVVWILFDSTTSPDVSVGLELMYVI